MLPIWYSISSHAQSKLDIKITNPSVVHLCIESDYVEIEVRNRTTSVVSGIETQVFFPKGVAYVKGSALGMGIAEKNVANLSSPVFSVSNIGVAQSRTIKLKMAASCDLSSFLNNGGLALLKTTTLYTSGSVQKNGNVLNIRQPALLIQGITNQLKTADLGDTYERQITLKNSGLGKLERVVFNRLYNKGQQLIAWNGNQTTKNGNNTTTILDSNDFKTIGNRDIYFDYNETYVFTDSIKVVSCNDLTATYTTSWGCDSSACKKIQKSANTSISSKSPDLVITPISSTTSCLSDTYSHDQQLIIFNKGDDTARFIDLDIFQSAGYGYRAYMISKIIDSSFTKQTSLIGTSKRINPYSTTATNTTGVYACLGKNAVGQVFLDLGDMAPGDSIILRWKTKSCCPSVCNLGTIYNQRWKYKASYRNQCNTLMNYNERYGSVGAYQSFRMSKLIPTDITDGETKQLEFTVNNGYLFYQSTRSQMTIQLKLPKTITHSLSSNDLQFTHPNGTSWLPNRIIQRNDTVFATFNGRSTVTLPRSELLINIKGNCQNNTTNSTQNIAINIMYNPDTTCSSGCDIPLYCTNDFIKIHCSTSCNTGLHFRNFEARRISYGLADNNNDGIPDPNGVLNLSKIKRNRIMYGDTLLTTFRGRVNNAGAITNWSYGKATTTFDYGRYLSAREASLSIYRNGLHVITCTQVPYTFTATGNARTYTFDISLGSLSSAGCLVYPTFRYRNTDSLVLNVKYVVDQSLNNWSVDLQMTNRFYLSSVANPSSSQIYSCDDFSARLRMLGYYFTNYGTNNLVREGCTNFNISQNFYLSVGRCCTNYAGGNIFPYEYRPWAKLREIILQKPAGFDVTNGSFRQYRTRGTGATANQLISSINPYVQTATEIKYRTDSLYTDLGGSILISDDGFHGTYTASLTPNCKVSNTTNNFIYGFVFEKLGYLGTGLDTIMTSNTKDIVNYTRPDLNITVTDDYVYPQKDTIEWEIRVKNVNTRAASKNVWLGALANSNREIVAIKDKLTNQFLTKNKDIFKAGDFSGGTQKDYIVYATYSSCNKDSIQLRIGYDCSSYPDSILAYQCSYASYNLIYEPINTRLDAAILSRFEEIDLCKRQAFQVQINNTGAPKVFDTYLDIQVQPGMILEDTAWLFKDGRKDSICVSSIVRVGPNIYRWDFSKRDSLFDKNGLNGVNSSTGYKMVLKFWLTTDCNYTSGSSFLLRPGGYLKCGNPVNAPYLLSDPIDIKGVVKPYFSAISFHMNPLIPCNYNDSTYAKFINLGPDSTGITDQFVLSLPPGILVDTNYVDKGHNAPTQKPSLDNSSGQNIYSWSIPRGISPGDSSVFQIKTTLDNYVLSCGIQQIYAQAIVKSSAMCVSSGKQCDIKVATSSLQRADSVIKESYALSFLKATSVPKGKQETVDLTYAVTNTGIAKKPSSLLITQLVYDANQNGVVDSGDAFVAQDTIIMGISNGERLTRKVNFDVSSKYTCDLLLYLSDSNCVCNSTVASVSNIQLLNAGKDTIICPNESIVIGSVSDTANTYQWNHSSLLNNDRVSNPLLTAQNTSSNRRDWVMVLTTNKGSCSSKDTAIITVYAGMEINMPDTASICKGDKVPIGYLVTGGESKLKQTAWSPIDSISNTTGFYTYAYPDTNTWYTLTVSDLQGCSVQDSTLVQVISKPQARIGLQDTCAGLLFTFENKTEYYNSKPDSISWNLGTLGTSTFNTPKYFIDSAQEIKARLYVSNAYGCWDTITQVLDVYPNPEVQFSYEKGCEESLGLFYEQSILSHGNLSHQWQIDGNSYDKDSVRIALPNKDSIRVSLTATTNRGCVDSFSQWVGIYDKPEIALQLSNRCQNDSVLFVPQLLPGTRDSIISYQWNFGDQTVSSQKTINYLYADTGTYQVSLRVSTAQNCSDTALGTIRIQPLPKSQFRIENSCIGDSAWAYSNALVHTGGISAVYWDVDGAGFYVGKDSILVPTNLIGTHLIGQKVMSDAGCVDSIYAPFSVYYSEMVDHVQQRFCEHEDISFTSVPLQPDSVAKTMWVIENDTLIGDAISYRFPNEGTFALRQIIQTNRGCESDSNFSIIIRPQPYTSIDQDQPCFDNTVDFASSAIYDDYLWTLSDGTTSTQQSFSHSFASIGKYNATLQVTNSFGCSFTAIDSGEVTHLVVPDFEIKDRCEDEIGWVYNQTSGHLQPITKATFEMGDGNTISALDSFVYQYPISGTYPVTLRITTLSGCDYVATKNVTVHPLPTAIFELFPETADIFSSEIEGTDESIGADSVFYYLSDGFGYGTPNFKHEFSDSGRYTIKQWVSSPFGCLDSLTKTIYISYAYNLFIPNAFTPTGDGLNDGFKPIGLGVKSYEITIYNRWGEKLFISDDEHPAWDGKDAIPGYYLYHIRASDFRGNVHYYKGTVNLLK